LTSSILPPPMTVDIIKKAKKHKKEEGEEVE